MHLLVRTPAAFIFSILLLPVLTYAQTAGVGKDSPVSLVGEKFFRESRFSQFFFDHAEGRWNQLLSTGDPVVETVESLQGLFPNPYKGQSISCASCHFVDQTKDNPALGIRAYTDFSKRSRIPERGDGLHNTVRNSPNMVAMALREGMFLHSDGEYSTAEDLTRATFLGRNMGWLANEGEIAAQHIVNIIRKDNGSFPTDTDLTGLSYERLLAGQESVPLKFRIPPAFRIDVAHSTDDQVLSAMIRLVGQYLAALDYSRDEKGDYNGSPFDTFLRKNNLPLHPSLDESPLAYSNRLLSLIEKSEQLKMVDSRDGQFKIQAQNFVFGEQELRGFKVFFGNGRCTTCHSAPDFTDHLFHNTGTEQFEYDSIHGNGSFAALPIPDLQDRNANAEFYLPPTAQIPNAKSMYRSIPNASDALRVDLGVWVVLFNPYLPNPQTLLKQAVLTSLGLKGQLLSEAEILNRSVSLFKTPTLRDLGQSAPYFHSGTANRIEDSVEFYEKSSQLAKANLLRNADSRMREIELSVDEKSRADLVSFLKSLNEDYN